MSWWRKLLSGEEKNTPSNNASVPNPDTIQSTESLIESPDTLDWQFIKEDELKPFDEISNVQITKSIKKLPITLNSQYIKAEDMKAFGEIFCDGYELTGNFTLDDILAFILNNKASHPTEHLFATLDDFSQASYTFGHACGHHLEEDTDEHFPWSELPTPERFLRRKENFQEKLKDITFDSVKGKRYWCDETSHLPSLVGGTPQFHEQKSYVQIVPVEKPYEALMAFPNGYFSDDYSPFENYRVAEYLSNSFAIELFGIGASYMGFRSDVPMEGNRLTSISAFITSLYPPESSGLTAKTVSNILENETAFYFCYAER